MRREWSKVSRIKESAQMWSLGSRHWGDNFVLESEKRVLWIAAPQLSHPMTHQQRSFSGFALPSIRKRIRLESPLKRINVHYAIDQEGNLGVWNNVNEGRNLIPLLTGPSRRRIHVFRQQAVAQTLSGPAEQLSSNFLECTPDNKAVVHLLQLALEAEQVARKLLNEFRPKRLLVATQHSYLTRALTLVARQNRIPSVYVPHAPTADVTEYRDLPFNLALLRGENDRKAYISWGSRAERLKVIGDVSWQIQPSPIRLQHPKRIVVAPSPWLMPQLKWFFDCVNNGISSEFEVLPHPASRVRGVRQLVSHNGKVIAGARTVEYLSYGPSVVVVGSSGVALEALALGHAVIQLVPDAGSASYLFEQSSVINRVSNPQMLADEIGVQQSRWLPDATALRYARSWISATGIEAIRNGRDSIKMPIDAAEWALDAWQEPVRGVAE